MGIDMQASKQASIPLSIRVEPVLLQFFILLGPMLVFSFPCGRRSGSWELMAEVEGLKSETEAILIKVWDMGVSKKLGVPYLGVLIIRILLFRVLY